MRQPELRSPLARAVVPVAGGLGVIVLIGLLLWIAAAWIASREDPPETLVRTELTLGSTERVAQSVAESGPILIPGLNTRSGEVSLVLDHLGSDPGSGWRIYYAYPADRDSTCAITQVEHTSTFVDCEDRQLHVTDLAPPRHERPVLEDDQTTLKIDLIDRTAQAEG